MKKDSKQPQTIKINRKPIVSEYFSNENGFQPPDSLIIMAMVVIIFAVLIVYRLFSG